MAKHKTSKHKAAKKHSKGMKIHGGFKAVEHKKAKRKR